MKKNQVFCMIGNGKAFACGILSAALVFTTIPFSIFAESSNKIFVNQLISSDEEELFSDTEDEVITTSSDADRIPEIGTPSVAKKKQESRLSNGYEILKNLPVSTPSFASKVDEDSNGDIVLEEITVSNGVYSLDTDGIYYLTGDSGGNSVLVSEGITAEILLRDVTIDTSNTSGKVSFEIGKDSQKDVTLYLDGENEFNTQEATGLQK